MKSRATSQFWDRFAALPLSVQAAARAAYAQWNADPFHPSLHFKRVSPTQPLWSVRITANYRALGLRRDDLITWIWIGPHDTYDRLIRRGGD